MIINQEGQSTGQRLRQVERIVGDRQESPLCLNPSGRLAFFLAQVLPLFGSPSLIARCLFEYPDIFLGSPVFAIHQISLDEAFHQPGLHTTLRAQHADEGKALGSIHLPDLPGYFAGLNQSQPCPRIVRDKAGLSYLRKLHQIGGLSPGI